MNPYRKAALLLIRLIAFGFIIFSLFQFGFYFLLNKSGKPVQDSTFLMFLKTIPLFIGLGLLLKSNSIAKKLTEDFEE